MIEADAPVVLKVVPPLTFNPINGAETVILLLLVTVSEIATPLLAAAPTEIKTVPVVDPPKRVKVL